MNIPFDIEFVPFKGVLYETNERAYNEVFAPLYKDLIKYFYIKGNPNTLEKISQIPAKKKTDKTYWKDEDGNPVEKMDFSDMKEIRIGFYKFEFIKLTQAQVIELNEEMNEFIKAECWEIGKLVVFFRKARIAYRLKFYPNPKLSKEENLELYGKEFLPFYRELLDKNLLVEV